MPFASGSGTRIAYVPEVTFGVTPAAPAFKILRVTGAGLRTNKTTGTSNEIRDDRNVSDEFQLGQDGAGAYNIEWSYQSFDDMLEGLLQNAWSTNVLKNGKSPKSFTFEETLEMGVTDDFFRFPGVMVNSMSLAIAARAAVTGTLNLMATKEETATAIVTDATYAAPGTKPIATASANVAALTVAAGTPKVRSLNMEITNNLRTRPRIGSLFSEEFGSGRFEVSGTLEAYFENATLYESALAHGGGALAFTIGNAANEKYAFLLPKIIFGNVEKRVGGNDDDVMVNLPWRAVYDGAETCTLKITRAVA